jgi:phosphate starvation-inducible protein PhoH and related proteins
MATKKAPRRRKETDVTNEFTEHIKKNFDCTNIKMRNPYPLTDNQQKFYYISQTQNTNMIFVDGPAGSAKSFWAVYSALELLKNRQVDRIIYIRSVVESSSRSIGYLKGDENEKFHPYIMPMMDKLNEILDKQDIHHLMEHEYIKAIPVNFVRGLTFHRCAVIVDEAQNTTRGELTTILTRFGRHSKYFVLGDANQADIKDSGFLTVFDLFNSDFSRKNDIHCVKFDTSDIVRSNILKHITQILKV